MKIHSLQLENLRCFKNSDLLNFSSPINIFIGKNNTGKSTILKSLYLLQKYDYLNHNDIRIDKNQANILIGIHCNEKDKFKSQLDIEGYNFSQNLLDFELKNNATTTIPKIYKKENNTISYDDNMKNNYRNIMEEPNNQIIFYSTKRFTDYLSSKVGKDTSKIIEENYANIVAKIDTLKRGTDELNEYINICNKIISKDIQTVELNEGKTLAIVINSDKRNIEINNLGDGTLHILGLIYFLVTAKNKIFLIEEIENYLHPKALKDLLDIIIEKSNNNQFFITTHSNIIPQNLSLKNEYGLFRLDMNFEDNIPTTTIKQLTSPIERFDCFKEIGYELSDFNLWEGWLILEESSAETFINQYFIPWFCKSIIGKLRTVSANGNGSISNRLEALYSMFIYHHRTPIYKNKAWIVIDGDAKGKEYQSKFIDSFCKKNDEPWNEENFILLSESNFEKYYPKQFQEEVNEILKDIENKRERKKSLLLKVIEWTNENMEESKQQFEESAKEIIDILKKIEKKL